MIVSDTWGTFGALFGIAGEEAVRATGEVGVAEVDADTTVARDRRRLLVHPGPVLLVVGLVRVDEVLRTCRLPQVGVERNWHEVEVEQS